MYDPERGWSLSFAGCGFLGFYHIGATHCLSERAPHLLRDARMFLGSSAGALHCVTIPAGIPLDQVIQVPLHIVQRARSRNMGILHPSFSLSRCLREALQKYLPANIHQLISGRVFISLTRVSDLENVLVSEFQSKDEVVDRYVDGGVTNTIPSLDAKTTITVSPFHGESDICPKVKSTNFLHVEITKLNMRLCSENMYLLSRVLSPPDSKVLTELCFQGYMDAVRFLEENGIHSRPHPCLNSPLQQPDVLVPRCETRSPEASPGEATWQKRPEGDQPLDHLRLSTLPWDENMLKALSPQLTLALREAFKTQGGYMSKIFDFLPVKVMSYLTLPCTLPMESAIAVVQRLLLWLPDISDDIQWLRAVTSQVCSRAINRLLPTSRSQILASNRQPFPHEPEQHGTSGRLLPMDLGTCPVDCPVGAKAQAAWQSILQPDTTFPCPTFSAGASLRAQV